MSLLSYPDHPNAYKNLAWLQATCTDERFRAGADAVQNANRAMELAGWTQADWQAVLAAAYAEAGDFNAAIQWQTKALDAVTLQHRAISLERLSAYKVRRAWRETNADASG